MRHDPQSTSPVSEVTIDAAVAVELLALVEAAGHVYSRSLPGLFGQYLLYTLLYLEDEVFEGDIDACMAIGERAAEIEERAAADILQHELAAAEASQN